MNLRKLGRIGLSLALVAGLAGLTACDDDGVVPGDPDQLLAVWNVNSFASGDTDLIADGMTLVVTLDNDGTYTFEVTNDMADICGGTGGEDCTVTGSFAHDDEVITINDDDPQDATTFEYTINGASMVWTGSIGGTPVVLNFTEVS